MKQSIKDMISAIETNIERYKIQKDKRAVQAAERMIADLRKMLAAE